MDPMKLAQAGYAVFPIRPDDRKPRVKWRERATSDPATVRRWWKVWPDSLIGLPTGARNGFAVLDLDRKDGKDGVAALAALGIERDCRSPVEVTTRSGGLHRFFAWRDGIRNSANKIAPGVDVRGEGGYVVAWDEGDALLGDAIGLPDWPSALENVVRPHESKGEPKPPLGLTEDEARAVLDLLPERWVDDRDDWLRVGMALHHEFGEEGRDLWDEWSGGSAKFDEGGQDKAWASFRDDRGDGTTMRSLVKETGWERPLDVSEVYDDLEPEAFEEEAYDEDDATEENVPSYQRAQRLNKDHAAVLAGGQFLILREEGSRVDLYSDTALSKWYKNLRLPFKTPSGQKTTKPISEVWLMSRRRRSYAGLEFDPGREPSSHKDGRGGGAYNLWRGWSVEPKPGASCARFLWHVENVICAGDPDLFWWVIRWMAHLVQRPWEKPGTALIFKGRRGTGKDLVATYLGRMFREHYVPVGQPKHVTGNFNNHMASCLLLHIEEGFWAGDRQAEQILKHIITSPTMQIEKKGVDPVPVRSCFRIIETSNEKWSVPAGEGERRFCICAVSDVRKGDDRYFLDLVDEMDGEGPAGLLAYLRGLDLTGFNVRQPITTEALFEEQVEGLRGVPWWWGRILEDGELPTWGEADDEDDVWPSEVDRDTLYADYCRAIENARYKGAPATKYAFSQEMSRMGVESARKGKGGRDRIFRVPEIKEARRRFRLYVGG